MRCVLCVSRSNIGFQQTGEQIPRCFALNWRVCSTVSYLLNASWLEGDRILTVNGLDGEAMCLSLQTALESPLGR